MRPLRSLTPLLIAIMLVAIWGVAYGFSLRMPLFLDDIPHFRWMEGQTWLGILTSSRGIGYYRPLPFLVWKLLRSLQGVFHAPTLHWINLVLHLLNTFLVYGLVNRQARKQGWLVGGASALLFLLYPFSYQAVPWVGSLTHPLVTIITLGSLYLYRIAESRPSGPAGTLSVALAFLAPLVHETGILTAPLLCLLLLTDEERPPFTELLRRTRFHWLGGLVGLAIWLAVPKSVRPPQVWNLEARYQNGVYLLQGLAYPVAPLARKVLLAGWGLDDLQSILLICGPAVVLWWWLVGRKDRQRLLTLASGWFLLTVAPAWLMLGFEYIVDAPRLLYLSSAGIALFWAAPLYEQGTYRYGRMERIAAGLAVLSIALGSYTFIHQRAAIYEGVRRWIDQFVQSIRLVYEPGPILCINCPEFLAPREPTFAVGHEGGSHMRLASTGRPVLGQHRGGARGRRAGLSRHPATLEVSLRERQRDSHLDKPAGASPKGRRGSIDRLLRGRDCNLSGRGAGEGKQSAFRGVSGRF